MRILGFIGIFLLLCINILGFYFAAQDKDLKGMCVMIFMAGMLLLFARILWQGRQLSQGGIEASPLAEGWAGQSVQEFFTQQVAKSIEGRIFLIGAGSSLLFAVLILFIPIGIGVPKEKSIGLAGIFFIWPILAFALYVKVCGPEFRTTLFNILVTTSIAVFPFYEAYKHIS